MKVLFLNSMLFQVMIGEILLYQIFGKWGNWNGKFSRKLSQTKTNSCPKPFEYIIHFRNFLLEKPHGKTFPSDFAPRKLKNHIRSVIWHSVTSLLLNWGFFLIVHKLQLFFVIIFIILPRNVPTDFQKGIRKLFPQITKRETNFQN
jgi:hypothetical protein